MKIITEGSGYATVSTGGATVNLKTALGYKGTLMAYWMPWFGEPGKVHRHQRYPSNSTTTINSQLDAMQTCGIDGVIAVWQGPFRNPFTHDAWFKMFLTCLQRGMPFLTLLDQWVARGLPDPTGAVIEALRSAPFQEALPFMSDRWVLEFDLAASAGVDVARVDAAFPDIKILSRHVDYSWPETANTIAALKYDNARASMTIPGVCFQFNDGGYPLPGGVGDVQHFAGQRDYNASVWDHAKPARVVDQQAGGLWHDQRAVTPLDRKYLGLITWNDYDEGTALEGALSAFCGVPILP